MTGTIKASESPNLKEEFISTGVLAFDDAVGGVPRRRITELSGSEGSGKTTLVQTLIASAQKEGLVCLLIDAERALNFERTVEMGVELDKLEMINAPYGEEYFDILEERIKEGGNLDLIIIDSIPALTPRKIKEATNEQELVGVHAKMIARFLPEIRYLLEKYNVAMLVTNQRRENIGAFMFQDKTILPGGKSLAFFKDVAVKFDKVGKIKQGEVVIGSKIKGHILKSKVGASFVDFEMSLLFSEGFSSSLDLLQAALEKGIITKTGNTLWFDKVKLGVGINKSKAFLKENPDVLEDIKKLL